ncbi:hypothetical protein BDA96_10G132100 [Sorghum bicolor]|uniref:Uncharacterized protein n=1 Tax=Sorghum bicolor TaxID=4558 RepID=A0A921Q3K9_SORBI|nr:hypothetical protein BDA96_10G132100 [Sorghum bicolor]
MAARPRRRAPRPARPAAGSRTPPTDSDHPLPRFFTAQQQSRTCSCKQFKLFLKNYNIHSCWVSELCATI